MALLTDVRRFIRRKRSTATEVELDGTQARNLAALTAAERPADDFAHVEPKPLRPSPRDLQDDVVKMVRRIGEHLDSQNERTDRLIELMERLPQSLEALPEINRQNARLLDIVTDHLDQARTREDTLNATLARLGETTSQQTQALGQVHEQLDQSSRLSGQMTDTLGSFRSTLTQLTATNTRSVEVLSSISRGMQTREDRMVSALTRTNRWMVAALIGCAAVAAAAVGLAVVAIVS